MSDGNGKDRTIEQPPPGAPPTFACVVVEGSGPCGKVAAGFVENGAGVDVSGMALSTMYACAEHLTRAHESGLWHAWFRRHDQSSDRPAAYAAQEHDHQDLDPFNEGVARNAAVALLAQVKRIEQARKPRSGLLIPDGVRQPPLDINQELIKFMHNVTFGLTSVLDMLLEARTGRPCLLPDPTTLPPVKRTDA